MPELTLGNEQKARLTAYIPKYLDWLNSSEGKTDVKQHRDHENFFKTMLDKKRISELPENGFRLLYKTLWAGSLNCKPDIIYAKRLLFVG